jgi:hydroxyethylthiazole kinase
MTKMDMIPHTLKAVARIRENAPLIHNITNFVVMNSSANILLAMGAAPVMAHCRAEVEEMTAMAGALVLNIGTLEEAWLDSMRLAARTAKAGGIPVILDPVGAGATELRNDAVEKILESGAVSVLRGNGSEILSLVDRDIKTRGVDSTLAFSHEMVDAVKALAVRRKCVVAISGEEDCITDGKAVFRVKNGHPLMTRVTGAGCGLSAVVAAFCATEEGKDFALATAAAFGFYGLCGELAAEDSSGPGSFQTAFLDWLYTAGEKEIRNHLKVHME